MRKTDDNYFRKLSVWVFILIPFVFILYELYPLLTAKEYIEQQNNKEEEFNVVNNQERFSGWINKNLFVSTIRTMTDYIKDSNISGYMTIEDDDDAFIVTFPKDKQEKFKNYFYEQLRKTDLDSIYVTNNFKFIKDDEKYGFSSKKKVFQDSIEYIYLPYEIVHNILKTTKRLKN